MDEWTVVVALGALMVIVIPILKLNSSIVRNTVVQKQNTVILQELTKENKCEHKEMRNKLAEHETRICIIEQREA